MLTPVAKRFSASVKRLLGGAGGRGKQVPFPVEFVTGPDAGRVITPSGKRPADLECLLASFIDVPASGNAVAIAVVDVAAQAVDHSDVLAEVSDSAAVSRCSAATASRCSAATASQRSADFSARPANVSARLAKVACAVAPSAVPAVCLSAGLSARQSRRARFPPSPAASPLSTSAMIAERAAICPWETSSPTATATPARPIARFRHAATSSTSSTSTAVSSTSTISRLSDSDSITTATSSTLSVPASLSSLSSLRRPLLFKTKSRSSSVTSIAVSVSVDICSVPDFSLASAKY
ncbi:hypothetical protein EV121DRAFT_286243 [Schizophyllum commune]